LNINTVIIVVDCIFLNVWCSVNEIETMACVVFDIIIPDQGRAIIGADTGIVIISNYTGGDR